MLIKSPTKSTFLLDFSCGTILGGRLGYEKWFRPQNIAQAGVDFVCGLSPAGGSNVDPYPGRRHPIGGQHGSTIQKMGMYNRGPYVGLRWFITSLSVVYGCFW